MKYKFYGMMVLLMVLVLLPTSCGREPQIRPDQTGEKKTKVAVSSAATLTDDYKIFKTTMEDKAKAEHLELMWLDAQNSALKQEEDIQKALREKVKVMIIEPVNAEMITGTVQKLQEEGIKVICTASLPPDTAIDAYIAPDFLRAGEMQAQQVLAAMKNRETVNLLILRGSSDNPASNEIMQGNMNILDAHKKTGQVWIEEIDADNSSVAFDRVKEYLTGTSAPDAVLAHSPEITVGMLKALEQHRGAGKVKSFGMGAQKQAVDSMKKGAHTAEIDFMPDLLAQIVTQAAAKLGGNEPWEYEQQIPNGANTVPARFTPTRAITQENIALLKERTAALKAGGGPGAPPEAEGQGGGQNGGNQEEGSQGGSPGNPGNSGDEKKQKTVVKVRTKDGQEFEMNISGEIESIEMKGEDQKKGEEDGGEKGGGEAQQGE